MKDRQAWVERTHYSVPGKAADILLYRTHGHHLCYSSRTDPSANWSAVASTSIPTVIANMNAGRLPDGRVFLAHNPVVHSQHIRDPLVLSLSRDGERFGNSSIVASCLTAEFRSPQQPNGCRPRNRVGGASPGPQYPQAVVVQELGLVVVAFSVNKEDIWVKSLTLSEL